MAEHRKHPRCDLADEGWRAGLVDQLTGERLGEVVNLSRGGMMLLAAEPLEPESIYQAELTATGPHGEHEQFSAGVLALWSSPAGAPGSSWVGLEIIDIAPPEHARLTRLTTLCGGEQPPD
ncbi:MAG: PilZ domain-containing protein [Gammaproteobacteria bacterium]|jgi:hypothetical protein